MSFIDALFICCGFYIIYQSYTMKKDGFIPEGVMLNKGTILPKEADIAGFILNMFWKGILTGLAAAVSGALGILCVNTPSLEWIAIVGYFGFVAIVVWFIVYLKIAHKKYLHIK